MTNLDDLKIVWQSQSGISQQRFEQIATKVRSSSYLLQKKIFHRDMAETLAVLLVLCFFIPPIFLSNNGLERLGFVIIVVGACVIPLVLWWGRKRPNISTPEANFRDYIDIEIGFLKRQTFLLRMVAWWYILPCYIGILVFILGLRSSERDSNDIVALVVKVAVVMFITGFMVYIWWLNQAARKKYLEPLLQYYVDMRAGLDRDDLELQLSDPPIEFLHTTLRKPVSKLRRWIGASLTIISTIACLGFGVYILTSFDARTGKFIIASTPVISLLVIVVTGIWRRNPKVESTLDP